MHELTNSCSLPLTLLSAPLSAWDLGETIVSISHALALLASGTF